jgi:hypothetical protein
MGGRMLVREFVFCEWIMRARLSGQTRKRSCCCFCYYCNCILQTGCNNNQRQTQIAKLILNETQTRPIEDVAAEAANQFPQQQLHQSTQCPTTMFTNLFGDNRPATTYGN